MREKEIDSLIRETLRQDEAKQHQSVAANDAFVQRVMVRLPRRRSVAERLWDGVLVFVLSPLFLLLVLVGAVAIFWHPMLALLAQMSMMPISTMLVILTTGIGLVGYVTCQMVSDLKMVLSD